jgi:hypothetical protein
MGGGGSQNSTVRNVTEVDPVTQAWRSNIMQAGANLYNQGTPNYYPGQTVVPFSQQTQSGLDYLQNHAMGGAPNLGAANAAAGRSLSGWNPAMPFAANAAQGGLNNQNLGGLSQFGNGVNPHLDGLFNRGAEQVTNAVNANFAQAGRFGANAAHTGALTRGIGDLYSSIYAPAYETERNRGLQAQTALAGYGDANANRRLAGADLLGGLWSQGNQDAARQQALLPSLFSYGQMPGQAMLDVGGIYEGQAQNYINDDRARYDYQANAPWQYLQQYAGMMSGLPDFSSSTQTQTQPGPNRLMQGLGAASSIASLFAAFSDRRLKREIEPLDADINGTPLYRFAYLWDAPGVKRVGVMADEAPPHAVYTHASGFLCVDYGAL